MQAVGVGTRDQIIEAALRLFASNGYKQTTVAAIESESGLSPGSGGMYRHFTSKQAVLEAAVSWAEANAYGPASFDERLLDTKHPVDALRAAGESALTATRRASDFHLALMRTANEQVVDVEEVRDRLVVRSYHQFAQWLEIFANAGAFRHVDFQATAATALGSIVWFHYASVITGATPSAIDEERFLATWVDQQWTYLRADGTLDR